MDQPMSSCFDAIENVTKNITRSDEKSLLVIGVASFMLAVPTAAANALVIVAILTTSSLRTPSYLLLTSLAFSDLAVGLLGQPLFSAMIFSFKNGNAKAYCYFRSISSALLAVFYCVTVFTLTAISVDRYLAIRLKMRYRSVVTLQKTKYCVASIWIYSFASVSSLFFIPLMAIAVFGTVEIATLMLVMIYCYTMSFRALQNHCAQTHPQGNQQPNSTTQANAIDVLKYRKLLNTMIIIVILLFIFCLPFLGVLVVFSDPNPNRIVAGCLLNITALNSLFNPVIYMTRMKDLRQVCLQMMRKTFRFCS